MSEKETRAIVLIVGVIQSLKESYITDDMIEDCKEAINLIQAKNQAIGEAIKKINKAENHIQNSRISNSASERDSIIQMAICEIIFALDSLKKAEEL